MSESLGVTRLSLKKRIIGTIVCILLYRLLANIPLPFVDMQLLAESSTNSSLNLLSLVVGGNMSKATFGALGVLPYITASILVQLVGIMIPSIHELQKSGFVGQQKIKKLTVYLSFLTAVPNALILHTRYQGSQVLLSDAWYVLAIHVVLLMATSGFLSLMGMYIDDHFFGNGMSLILVSGIVAVLPSEFTSAFAVLNEGKTIGGQILSDSMFVMLIVMLMIFVCWLLECHVDLPLVGSQKAVDEDALLMVRNVLPLRVLSTSVMPVVFASSMFSLPLSFAQSADYPWLSLFDMSKWFTLETWWASFGSVIYFCMICLFSRYAQMVELNETEIADNLRKAGFVIQGVGPGRETELLLRIWMRKLNKMGSVGLAVVSILPVLLSHLFGLPSISLLGTSLILLIHVMRDLLLMYRVEFRGQTYLKLLPILVSHRKGEAFCLLEKVRLND